MNIIANTAKPERRIPNYTGPEGAVSNLNEKAAEWLRPVNHGLANLIMRVETEGAENIPQDGAHILCFNHQSMTDAILIQSVIGDADYRFVGAKEQFTGPIGKAMTALGTIPVDRGGASQREMLATVKHLLDNNTGVAIAPEGASSPAARLVNSKKAPL